MTTPNLGPRSPASSASPQENLALSGGLYFLIFGGSVRRALASQRLRLFAVCSLSVDGLRLQSPLWETSGTTVSSSSGCARDAWSVLADSLWGQRWVNEPSREISNPPRRNGHFLRGFPTGRSRQKVNFPSPERSFLPLSELILAGPSSFRCGGIVSSADCSSASVLAFDCTLSQRCSAGNPVWGVVPAGDDLLESRLTGRRQCAAGFR